MKISVLGCGRWGTFLAWYAKSIGHDVLLWGREGSKRFEELINNRSNAFLTLQNDLKLTNDLEKAVSHGEIIIISISCQSLRSFLSQINDLNVDKNKLFLLCMKGMESNSGKRLTTVFAETVDTDNVAVWVGPGHVQSFIRGVPNCMVVDSLREDAIERAIDALGSDLIRFYYGTDLIGTEIGAATKNVVGIAAGVMDGLEMPALKGALMARAPREIARLIKSLGGNEQSAYSLAHLGDYEATLFSLHSNNRKFGEDLVKGKKFEKLAEGVSTLDALKVISREKSVELPICDSVYRLIFENANPHEEIDKLIARPIKREFA